jgi:hypothetical protein
MLTYASRIFESLAETLETHEATIVFTNLLQHKFEFGS